MLKLKEAYSKRDEASNALIKETFEFKNKVAPYIINDVNYWVFGDDAQNIPDGYFSEDPRVMFDQQISKIKRHYENYSDDCYISFLMPWFGTGVLASGFGTQVRFQNKMDPAVEMSAIKSVEEMDALRTPDPHKDGQMPRVLKQIEFFKANCDLPVGITDCQGPLTTALSIIGYENYIYWMMDYPDKIHSFMEKVSQALINWVKLQKEYIGDKAEDPGYIIGLKMPEGFGGVWIADDDAVIFNEALYREFVKPYNEKVLAAFGGGGIHFCGCATQHIENYKNTKGLTCLHNLHQDDFGSVTATAKAMQDSGKAFYICDYAPDDDRIEPYYDELFKNMDPHGLIVASYVAPAIALKHGKYEIKKRDSHLLGKMVETAMQEKRKIYSYSMK